MKKFWISVSALAIFLVSATLVKQTDLKAEPADTTATATTTSPSYDKIAQEAERNRELLEIWKDHVKTLTKERDDAFEQLEQLKASRGGSPVAQFGAVESMPLPASEAAQQIESLQSEVSRLTEELQKRSSSTGDSGRDLQMQFSALQSQLQQVKKELSDTRGEKDRLIQAKEKALSQAERLEAEVESLRAGGQESSSDQARIRELESQIQRTKQSSSDLASMQSEILGLREENARLKSDLKESIAASSAPADRDTEAFMRQSRELQYENDNLKAQVEKSQVVEKELANTRAYFTPMVKELQDKNDRLTSDNASLKADVQRARAETVRASQKMSEDLRGLKSEQEEMATQMAAYKSQLQIAAADKEKFRATEEELKKTQVQLGELQKAYAGLEQNSKTYEAQIQQLNAAHETQIQQLNAQIQQSASQVAALQKANDELGAREMDNMKSVEKYQTALSANLTDMKNLKQNFEAYLESLVASFDERQK